MQLEPLEQRVLLAADFGDAPQFYPTLFSENGPQHLIAGPTLGGTRDAEADGTHSSNADADGADDDGVTFGAIQVGQLGATVTVNVQGGAAKLDAWIDFNGDGSWGGPGEQILDNLAVVVGDNALGFDVPSWAIDGVTYARFRLSTAGDLGVGGTADDGEVEDYAVAIAPPTAASGFFTGDQIIGSAEGVFSVVAADIDGDGDDDVLSASLYENAITWYENDGGQNFTEHPISIDAAAARSVFAVDVDGDGDLDVLSASAGDNKVAWYENDGYQNFTAHIISTAASGAISVFAADVDADGDIDVLSASPGENTIAWYENDGGESFSTHTISTGALLATSVHAADLDGDGDLDVLSASSDDSKIAWYENDGSQVFTAHTISTSAALAYSVVAADIDGDGDMDVVSGSAYDDKVAWYENDGNQNFAIRTISTAADGAFNVQVADVDGDGDLDVLSASIGDNKIAWYENRGNNSFSVHVISVGAIFATSVFASDIDGDGDLDVLSSSISDNKLAWYENQGADFGDAPLYYPTLRSELGANHLDVGPTLGATRDTEVDGTHSTGADADGADEDGVVLNVVQAGQFHATLAVNVQGGAARLDAWIDFTGDGRWDDPGEKIFDNVAVSIGDNTLEFDVPEWAVAGVSYARFRLSSAGGLDFNGLAIDGEVEDYPVTLLPAPLQSGTFSSQHVISTSADEASDVFVIDLDLDGDQDALSASRGDNKLAWYENDGAQGFFVHTITTSAAGAASVFAVDVDGDGDFDVLSAGDDTVAWYENDGDQNFTARLISTVALGAVSVVAADVDGDGDVDVLSASAGDNRITWYENDGDQNFTTHTITSNALGASRALAIDVDGDNDVDVLSASSADNTITWYENDGSQNFTAHAISTNATGARAVYPADIDGDGDLDVLSASSGDDKIAWYENDGSQNFGIRTITQSAAGATDVLAIDVDNDGDVDVISASSDDNAITWYENDGSQNFTLRVISTDATGASSISIADVDSDGDLDLGVAVSGNNIVAWYANLRPDFGDAPAPYPTLAAEFGAQHHSTGPRLGATRDHESDGAHSANADADGADEDGVTFGTIRVGQLGATVTVNIQGGPAKLDAWIDFNGDGNWGGPSEHIFDSLAVTVGDNLLAFDVPSWSVDGVVYARFRLSTAGDIGVGGTAVDGEVEDYALTLLPPVATAAAFRQSVISTAATGARSVVATDLDGDGDMDVLSASSSSELNGAIVWHENNGSSNFESHTITTGALRVRRVLAEDLDGDGDIDVLGDSYPYGKITWYENDGSQNFLAHTIDVLVGPGDDWLPADIDGDGDLDLILDLGWLENDGSQQFSLRGVITGQHSNRVAAADLDSDGDMDLVINSTLSGQQGINWYENNGSQAFTGHMITTLANGASSVLTADLDGDGDLDVVAATPYGNAILWFENDGSQNFATHTITSTLYRPLKVFVADVDGDGDLDVVSVSSEDNTIAWYRNDGSQQFTPQVIFTNVIGALDVFAADVDGDGDLDVLAASQLDWTIAWYENTNGVVDVDFGDAPQFYPTLYVENGAWHTATGPKLGATRDVDADGAHSTNANADGADEDGITFGTIRAGQSGATVAVNVQGGSAKLDAWIDFNADGSWDGPGEHVFASLPVSAGDNALSFDVPPWAAVGATYARFRLSTAGGLGISGAAADGEIEDYQLTIQPPAFTPPPLFGGKQIIGTGSNPRNMSTGDVDGDGDLDVVVTLSNPDMTLWYENDGSGDFVPHTITLDFSLHLITADVDGDGDQDVPSIEAADHAMAWYENRGSQGFTKHDLGYYVDTVFAADIDEDGDMDLFGLSYYSGQIFLFENDGNQNFTRFVVGNNEYGRVVLSTSDVDGDGDLDLLTAGWYENTIAWYENVGPHLFIDHPITNTAMGALSVFAADVDSDGDQDVLSGSAIDDTIAWYENDGAQNFTPHIITRAVNSASGVFAADFDGDGDVDVLSASSADNKIAWFENDGNQNFTARVVTTSAPQAFQVLAGDMDGDGHLDVLSASSYDGTVAWYANLNIEVDLGDAPAPYPTLYAENGASHLATGPTLGATRDDESDGTHSANADADGADEDGVTFGSIQVGQLGATVTVNVQGGSAKLDAWIDFNRDGTWGGPGEQIFDNLAVIVGDNVLSFDVPSWAIDGLTYARFRLSTAGDLGVGGMADNGEVEDDAVTIVAPEPATGDFGQHTVTTGADGARSVFAADMDGDGDMDILSASRYDHKIAWYENDGNQNFTTHTITTIAGGASSVFAADVDGDGDLDALSADLGGEIIWYENDGIQNFAAHTISANSFFPFRVIASDVDGDGDTDVLAASIGDGKIAWYENDGNQNFTTHTITTGALGASDVFVADLDGDGDLDVLSAADGASKIAWYENDGNQNFTTRTLTTGGATSVFATDLDGDGDMDILSAAEREAYKAVEWHENDGSQNFTIHTIASAANSAAVVFAADIDGDGDIDVVTGSFEHDTVAWYENDGSQNFSLRLISTAANGVASVFVADVDGDGDLDVLSASYFDDKIAWYENQNLISTVVGRHIFYNQSTFDGNSAAINASDNNAIAPDKTPLLANGVQAQLANITNYTRGINGIIIDLSTGVDHTGLTLANVANNFIFKVGNNNSPALWIPAPAPSALSMTAGGGLSGADRVTITWADNAIANKYLEVGILPTAQTGLPATANMVDPDGAGGAAAVAVGDLFFWGHLMGETASSTPAGAFARTVAADRGPILANGTQASVGITNRLDINKSNSITVAADGGPILAGGTGSLTRILIDTVGPYAPEGDGDAGIASALASTASPSVVETTALPAGIANRLEGLDLNSGRIAAFFQHLADQDTPGTRKILTRIDAVADELGLEHELLEELVAGLTTSY